MLIDIKNLWDIWDLDFLSFKICKVIEIDGNTWKTQAWNQTWALEIAIWLNLMSYNSAIIFWYMLLQKEEINKI